MRSAIYHVDAEQLFLSDVKGGGRPGGPSVCNNEE